MEGLAAEQRRRATVFLGVDTHSEEHVAVALDGAGRRIGELAVPNSEAGYAEIVGWVLSFGHPLAAGVEGTGSYEAGLARFFCAATPRSRRLSGSSGTSGPKDVRRLWGRSTALAGEQQGASLRYRER